MEHTGRPMAFPTQAQRLVHLQVLVDACASVVSLIRKPITPERLAKLNKKLDLPLQWCDPWVGRAEAVLQHSAQRCTEHVVVVGQAVEAQLLSLLLGIQRWLCSPAGAALWGKHDAAPKLLLLIMYHLSKLVTPLEVVNDASIHEAWFKVRGEMQEQARKAGFLQALPDVISAWRSHILASSDAQSATALVYIGQWLPGLLRTPDSPVRSNGGVMHNWALHALLETQVIEHLSEAVLAANGGCATGQSQAVANALRKTVGWAAECCYVFISMLCTGKCKASCDKDGGSDEDMIPQILCQPYATRLAEAVVATALAGAHAAASANQSPSSSCMRPHFTQSCGSTPPLQLHLDNSFSTVCIQSHMAVAIMMYCTPQYGAHLASATAALLMLEALLRANLADGAAWHWLAVLVLRLSTEHLERFVQVAAPYLVSELWEQLTNTPATMTHHARHTPLLTVLAIMCPDQCVSYGRVQGFEGINPDTFEASIAHVQQMASIGDGMLFAAVEQLLRRSETGCDDGEAAVSLLLSIFNEVDALWLLLERECLAAAMAGLIVSLGKWLRLKLRSNEVASAGSRSSSSQPSDQRQVEEAGRSQASEQAHMDITAPMGGMSGLGTVVSLQNQASLQQDEYRQLGSGHGVYGYIVGACSVLTYAATYMEGVFGNSSLAATATHACEFTGSPCSHSVHAAEEPPGSTDDTLRMGAVEQQQRLVDLMALMVCRVGAPAACFLDKLDAPKFVDEARERLAEAAARLHDKHCPAVCAQLEAALLPDEQLPGVQCMQSGRQEGEVQQQQQEGQRLLQQQHEQQQQEDPQRSQRAQHEAGAESIASAHPPDGASSHAADVVQAPDQHRASNHQALWQALQSLQLPQQALPGCHNPMCTNMDGACEAKSKIKVCGGCGVARFCSTACQKSAWPRHRFICKAKAASSGAASSSGHG